MTKLTVPESAYGWLNEEIKAALAEIEPPHVAKKRATVIRLAQAAAQQQPMKTVFESPETCNESIWYIKWQFDEKIKAALALAERRCLEWVDEQTAAQEEFFRQQRRRGIAAWAAQAPGAVAMVMTDVGEKGPARLEAARLLMGWADPSTLEPAQGQPATGEPDRPRGGPGINLDDLSEAELDTLIRNLETAEGGGAAGEAAAGTTRG